MSDSPFMRMTKADLQLARRMGLIHALKGCGARIWEAFEGVEDAAEVERLALRIHQISGELLASAPKAKRKSTAPTR